MLCEYPLLSGLMNGMPFNAPTSKKLEGHTAFWSFIHPSVSLFVMLNTQSRMVRDRILIYYIWNKVGK